MGNPNQSKSKGLRHHNNTGRQQIKSGSLRKRTERLAKRLGIPFGKPKPDGA